MRSIDPRGRKNSISILKEGRSTQPNHHHDDRVCSTKAQRLRTRGESPQAGVTSTGRAISGWSIG